MIGQQSYFQFRVLPWGIQRSTIPLEICWQIFFNSTYINLYQDSIWAYYHLKAWKNNPDPQLPWINWSHWHSENFTWFVIHDLGHKKRTSLQSTITPKHKLKAFWKEFPTKPPFGGFCKKLVAMKFAHNFQLPKSSPMPWIPRDPGSFFQNGNLNNLRFASVIIHPNRSSSDVRWARIPRQFGWWIIFTYLILRNRRPNVEWFNLFHLFREKLPHSGETL